MIAFEKELSEVQRYTLSSGEIVWNAEVILNIIAIARKHQRIILGGDILTLEGEYTYDNWYYNPDPNVSTAVNVERSISICTEYVDNYLKRNGNCFLFLIVFEPEDIQTCETSLL